MYYTIIVFLTLTFYLKYNSITILYYFIKIQHYINTIINYFIFIYI